MANINHISSANFGDLLKLYQTQGVYRQLSTNSSMWDFIKKNLKQGGKPEGKEREFALLDSYGASAFQFMDPSGAGAYPAAHISTTKKGSALFKDFGVTISVPKEILNKTGSDLAAYVKNVMAHEIEQKAVAAARALSRTLVLDGTGIIGKVASATVSGGKLVVSLSTASADAGKSHVGAFNYGEKVLILDSTLAAKQGVNAGPDAVNYFVVDDIDHQLDKVTFSAYDSNNAAITITTAGQVGSGDFILPLYDNNLNSINDLTVADYGKHSFMWAGLESLAANDGRVVNGLTMTGPIKGSRKDLAGANLDRKHFNSILTQVKLQAGRDRYAYNDAFVYPTVVDELIDLWESNRQVTSSTDNKLGTTGIAILHENDTVKIIGDEYVQKSRIWMLPKPKKDAKEVIQFIGTELAPVRVGGVEEYLLPNGTGHNRQINRYMEGSGMLYSVHPGAIACLENFIIG